MIAFIILLAVIMFGVYYATSKKTGSINPDNNPVQVNDIILADNILFYKKLDKAERLRFEKEVIEFLGAVKITGVDTTVENLDKILIAASAVIPVFAFPEWKYYDLKEILLYSDAINMNFESEGSSNSRDILGMVGTGYLDGKMLLSKPVLRLGFSNKTDKNNTAIHEFVHLIDKADGDIDGVPAVLLDKQFAIPWLNMMYNSMEKIKSGESDINAYGYTNKTEFFAVAAEYFFERPDLLKEKHPQLFEMLARVFSKKDIA
jgi:MtfA peptidase